jgi:ABC-type uncharacterized transport system auxiliary subunit
MAEAISVQADRQVLLQLKALTPKIQEATGEELARLLDLSIKLRKTMNKRLRSRQRTKVAKPVEDSFAKLQRELGRI